jgi:tRNA (mo5U34)-methyltransferase
VGERDIRSRADSIVWYHTIDLGDGMLTDGYCKTYLGDGQLPDFEGRTVLDIGAWDGYYSFLAERGGASRVVALDHYAWGVDFAKRNPYWVECNEKGALPDHSLDTTEFWDPSLPGMRGFELAREALGSRVEAVVGDFATMGLESLGRFDVVLFLGVLYHLREPFSALRRLRSVTTGVAVIETEALLLPGGQGHPYLEFTAGCYRGYDYSNWFAPTVEALHDMCRAAGFTTVRTVVGPPVASSQDLPTPSPGRLAEGFKRRVSQVLHPTPPQALALEGTHYRAVVHAWP